MSRWKMQYCRRGVGAPGGCEERSVDWRVSSSSGAEARAHLGDRLWSVVRSGSDTAPLRVAHLETLRAR